MHRSLIPFLVFIVGLTGCAGSRAIPIDPPESLVDVNHVLAGRDARVHLDDSTAVMGRGAAVFPDSVRFAGGEDAVPTARVRQVVVERDRLSMRSTAVAGLLVGLGAAGLVAFEFTQPAFAFAVLSGPFLMTGATLGIAVGMLDRVGSQERVVYEAPLSRYLPDASER
jgi:hypothetical protein